MTDAETRAHETSRTNFPVPLAVIYRSIDVDGVRIFYREAGHPDAPTLLLLHGYPSSSRMFEPLFAFLSTRYRLVAPDYPGFGLSEAPDKARYHYTFDHLAESMLGFTDALGLTRYAIYMQDYGGPIGFRLAMLRPERIQALIIQNAVIHEEGLTAAWELRRKFWADRSRYQTDILDGMFSVPAGIARHVGDRKNVDQYDPDLWMDEIAALARPGISGIQLDLVYDYQSNVKSYPIWQTFLRERRPPTLVVWGLHDPIFSVAGAHAIKREHPDADVHVLDAGHFATYDLPADIAKYIRIFMKKSISS